MTRSVLITVTFLRDLGPVAWTCTCSLLPLGFLELLMCWCLRPSRPRGDKGADAVGPQHPCVAVVLCFWAPGGRPGGRDRRGGLGGLQVPPFPEEGVEGRPRNAHGASLSAPAGPPPLPGMTCSCRVKPLDGAGCGGRGGVAGRGGVVGPTLGRRRRRRWGIGAASQKAAGQPGKAWCLRGLHVPSCLAPADGSKASRQAVRGAATGSQRRQHREALWGLQFPAAMGGEGGPRLPGGLRGGRRLSAGQSGG